jgi:hypothetical protein
MALKKYRKALRYLDICWEKEGIDEGAQSLRSSFLVPLNLGVLNAMLIIPSDSVAF